MTPNERRPNETQAQYRDRLKKGAVDAKENPRFQMLWHDFKGTYVRARHGDLTEGRW